MQPLSTQTSHSLEPALTPSTYHAALESSQHTQGPFISWVEDTKLESPYHQIQEQLFLYYSQTFEQTSLLLGMNSLIFQSISLRPLYFKKKSAFSLYSALCFFSPLPPLPCELMYGMICLDSLQKGCSLYFDMATIINQCSIPKVIHNMDFDSPRSLE